MTPTDSLPQAQINHKGKHEQKLISGKTECKHSFGVFGDRGPGRGRITVRPFSILEHTLSLYPPLLFFIPFVPSSLSIFPLNFPPHPARNRDSRKTGWRYQSYTARRATELIRKVVNALMYDIHTCTL